MLIKRRSVLEPLVLFDLGFLFFLYCRRSQIHLLLNLRMEADCFSKETVDLHIDLVVPAMHYSGPLADHLRRDFLSDTVQVAVPPTCTQELTAGCVCLPLAECIELRIVIELAGVSEV